MNDRILAGRAEKGRVPNHFLPRKGSAAAEAKKGRESVKRNQGKIEEEGLVKKKRSIARMLTKEKSDTIHQ